MLLCRLTYKHDWDLPGGVVEVGESPQLAVAREVEEEFALQLPAAGCCSPTGCRRGAAGTTRSASSSTAGCATPSVLDDVVLQEREIRDAEFCTLEEVRERCADFTARRVEAALANLDRPGSGVHRVRARLTRRRRSRKTQREKSRDGEPAGARGSEQRGGQRPGGP